MGKLSEKKEEKLKKYLERVKRRKDSAAAKKRVKTRRENERIKNEESGLGAFTNKELRGHKKISEHIRAKHQKKFEEGFRRWNEARKAETRKRKREEAKVKRLMQKKAKAEKEKERRRKARESAKRVKKYREKLSKRQREKFLHNNPSKPKPYIVYLSENGHSVKETGKIACYHTLAEAKIKVKELMATDKENVIFERLTKTFNDGTMGSNYEYVIFKDTRGDEPNPTYLRNEFGKYVEHNVIIRGKTYEIVDKYPAKVEDTLWVYGYDPRTDRKTFAWIFDNILNQGFVSSYDMKRIYLYHNKVVFRNDADDIDIIICKTASDAVRYYMMLQKYCKKGPYLFMGAVSTKNALCESLEKLLLEKTGWTVRKIRRNQNRF